MKMKTLGIYLGLFFLIGTAIVTSCKNSPKVEDTEEENPQVSEISFELKDFMRESSMCKQDTMRCARASAVYPVAVGPERIIRPINDTIMYYVKSSLAIFAIEESEVLVSIDTIARRFIEEYESSALESPDFAVPWEVDTQGEVLFQNPKLASVNLSSYSYAGGAHPNSMVTLLNFDLKTGALLELKDLVTNLGRLAKLAELRFRQVHELNPSDDLNDSGFFWGESFFLPSNFAVIEEGLYFYYNPYEAAAYALGPTDFTLKFEELEDILIKEKIF
jgi:hypothetical protein